MVNETPWMCTAMDLSLDLPVAAYSNNICHLCCVTIVEDQALFFSSHATRQV